MSDYLDDQVVHNEGHVGERFLSRWLMGISCLVFGLGFVQNHLGWPAGHLMIIVSSGVMAGHFLVRVFTQKPKWSLITIFLGLHVGWCYFMFGIWVYSLGVALIYLVTIILTAIIETAFRMIRKG